MYFAAADALAPLWDPSQGYQFPFISCPQRMKKLLTDRRRRLGAAANHRVLPAVGDVVDRHTGGPLIQGSQVTSGMRPPVSVLRTHDV